MTNKSIWGLSKRIDPSNPEGAVFDDEKAILVNELHAPYRKNYEKRAYIYRYLGELSMEIAGELLHSHSYVLILRY